MNLCITDMIAVSYTDLISPSVRMSTPRSSIVFRICSLHIFLITLLISKIYWSILARFLFELLILLVLVFLKINVTIYHYNLIVYNNFLVGFIFNLLIKRLGTCKNIIN